MGQAPRRPRQDPNENESRYQVSGPEAPRMTIIINKDPSDFWKWTRVCLKCTRVCLKYAGGGSGGGVKVNYLTA